MKILPKHLAIIMDGNGRWAKQRGKQRIFGHSNGVKSVREVVEECARLGIEYLTLFAFSTENWSRPEDEVNVLMKLLVTSLKKEFKKLAENNIVLKTIGNTAALPEVDEGIYNSVGRSVGGRAVVLAVRPSWIQAQPTLSSLMSVETSCIIFAIDSRHSRASVTANWCRACPLHEGTEMLHSLQLTPRYASGHLVVSCKEIRRTGRHAVRPATKT